MSIERAEMKNKKAQLKMACKQYEETAEGLCVSIRRELNTTLVSLDEQETASAAVMMDNLVMCMGELTACRARLMRIDLELSG